MKWLSNIPDKFFISLFLLMNFFGVLVYMCGGTYYKVPSDEALAFIFLSSMVVIFAYSSFSVIVVFFSSENHRSVSARKFINYENRALRFVLFCSILSCALYFGYFLENFPYWRFLFQDKSGGESARPDVVGGVPFYWGFSIILNSFAIPALVHFLCRAIKERSPFYAITLYSLLVVFFGFMLGGKAGLLSILFFILFFLYRPSLLKLLMFSAGFVGFYLFVKSLYYEGNVEQLYEGMSGVLLSIFRRVIMVNVSVAGAVWDELILSNGDIQGFNNLKQYAFYSVYGYLPGGAPVIFHTEIVYRVGYILLGLLAVFFFVLSSLFLRYFSYRLFDNREIYFLVYLNFYGAIIFATAGFFDFIVRYVIPLIFLLLVYLFSARFRKACCVDG